jgi:predicted phosphodiesterase
MRPTKALLAAAVVGVALIAAVSAQDRQSRQSGAGADAPASQRSRPRGPQGEFRTSVPAHAVDIILGRPTGSSITLSVLAYADTKAYVAYGTSTGELSLRTDALELAAGVPREVVLSKLEADTRDYYPLRDAADKPLAGDDGAGAFHTQRLPGSTFIFTVQADSHLDENTSTDLYRRTLANALADHGDFHIDLGDTFMVDKHASRDSAARQYLAQRYYLGLVARSTPLFLVLGNHDGEDSKLMRGGADSLAVWSNTMRKRYFPNPLADGFYGGNATKDPLAGMLQDYYSWQWGDALFVVLDPYWHSPGNRGDDCWGPSLGRQQYDWLARTLQASKARHKFVFIHQLVGGLDKQGRGGAEAAPLGEWGGRDADGADGFSQQRPLWDMPIHQLLARSGVSIVFHGHDHLFARQELDGIIYQEVPQPGLPAQGAPRNAAEYGYVKGDILGGAGHVRVTVSPAAAKVEYVRAVLPANEAAGQKNAQVDCVYTQPAKGLPGPATTAATKPSAATE